MTPAEIRAALAADPAARERDLARSLGLAEAQLAAARCGTGVTRIDAHPDRLMPLMPALGEVMALTRNDSAVHERVGTFGEYRSGAQAAVVLGKEIDLRLFPAHWVHGFAVEKQTDAGVRRSLQIFDAAGEAVQKIHLREGSDLDAWAALVTALQLDDQSDTLELARPVPTEAARLRPDNRDTLLSEWGRMTDTHQFQRLAAKLGMNRLGAYRLASGSCWVRPLDPSAVAAAFDAISAAGQEVILFVGNHGNIQIHWGPLVNIRPMGPWLNVMDPRFNLHLRADHLAEVYAVLKPTRRGPALSVEAFDAEGGLIFQMFGRRADDQSDEMNDWTALIDRLPGLAGVAA